MLNGLTGILIGSVLLGSVHVLIPNHWLPIITLGKTEKWTTPQTITATAIISFCHILSTILIGILIGLFSYHLASSFELYSKIFASLILFIIGFYYFKFQTFHKCNLEHEHHHHDKFKNLPSSKNYLTIVSSLSIANFFTPCVELDTYYISAGLYGWKAILMLSVIYAIFTVSTTVCLVYLISKGITKFKFAFIEKYEHQIVGLIMILVGIVIYFA